jgi:hypothetical protein
MQTQYVLVSDQLLQIRGCDRREMEFNGAYGAFVGIGRERERCEMRGEMILPVEITPDISGATYSGGITKVTILDESARSVFFVGPRTRIPAC